jgi:hypothetical protein
MGGGISGRNCLGYSLLSEVVSTYFHFPLLNFPKMATPQSILDKIAIIKDKRAALVRLLDQPNLGTLRIDVNQALEEIDDLLDEFEQTFPDAA